MRTILQFLLTFFLISCLLDASAQTDQWAWMSGDNIKNQFGVYGTKGTSAPGNKPGTRYRHKPMFDAAGNMWIFGGYGNASVAPANYLGDLWRYSKSTGEWTWMDGSDLPTVSVSGVYGTKGVAASGNKPGSRYDYVSWCDGNNLWIFGGYGSTVTSPQKTLNDLWKYNIASGLWTWVSGDNTGDPPGSHGAVGATGTPSGRQSAVSWYDPVSQKVWFFGGAVGAATAGVANDLWVIDPATGSFTYMGGNGTGASAKDQQGIYGAKGVAAAGNMPGAHRSAVGGIDANGNLLMFGGLGNATTATQGLLNDFWSYNIFTGFWTWISGDNVINQSSIYGTRLVPASTNKPGGRKQGTGFMDNQGNFYLFGGTGSNSAIGFSDLWQYNATVNQWIFMSGNTATNSLSTYGSKGTKSAANKPGARQESQGWIDAAGDVWIMGLMGNDATTGQSTLNDIFKYTPAVLVLPVKLTGFTAHARTNSIALSWTTAQEQNSSHFVIEHSVNGSDFDNIGIVKAMGNSSVIATYAFVDVNPSSGSNFYRLKQVDKDGNGDYSNVIKIEMGIRLASLRLLQNPAYSNLLLIIESPAAQTVHFRIIDATGHILLQNKALFPKGSHKHSIDISQLTPGTYLINTDSNGEAQTIKFVKQ